MCCTKAPPLLDFSLFYYNRFSIQIPESTIFYHHICQVLIAASSTTEPRTPHDLFVRHIVDVAVAEAVQTVAVAEAVQTVAVAEAGVGVAAGAGAAAAAEVFVLAPLEGSFVGEPVASSSQRVVVVVVVVVAAAASWSTVALGN